MLYIRRHDWRLALDDCNTALAKDPKFSIALYVRGLAALKLGQASAGNADIAAAETQAPEVVQRAKQDGLAP